MNKFFVSDSRCLDHVSNELDSPQRWHWINDEFHSTIYKEQGWQELINDRVYTFTDLLQVMTLVHDEQYLKEDVMINCQKETKISQNNEVKVGQKTINALTACVTSSMNSVDKMVENKTKDHNSSTFIFQNSRPPGHHAGNWKANGFCILNNAMITTYYALTKCPSIFKHISIMDFDMHFCEGSVDILKMKNRYLTKDEQSQVSLFSIHESETFPYKDLGNQTKYDQNSIHLRGMKKYCSYEDYYHNFLELCEKMQTYQPDLIVISCGFDACQNDVLSRMPVLPHHYEQFTELLLSICPNIISILEGGYSEKCMKECLRYHCKIQVQ